MHHTVIGVCDKPVEERSPVLWIRLADLFAFLHLGGESVRADKETIAIELSVGVKWDGSWLAKDTLTASLLRRRRGGRERKGSCWTTARGLGNLQLGIYLGFICVWRRARSTSFVRNHLYTSCY